MRKILKRTLTFAMTTATLLSLSTGANAVTADTVTAPEGAQPISVAVNQYPELAITEISANPLQIFFKSADTAKPDELNRTTKDVFEFVEVCNYNETAVDLNDYTLQITASGKTYTNPFVFEAGNDGVLEQGELAVIWLFSASSISYTDDNARSGQVYTLNYDEANIAAAWDAFNTQHGTNIPVGNRVLAPTVDTAGAAISGTTSLPQTGKNIVSLVKDGVVVSSAEYNIATMGLSQNYVYEDLNPKGEFLCNNGVSPYRLLHEQNPWYNPTFDFSGEKLRVVSYNLLFNGYVMEARKGFFVDFLKTYSPDIVALQEIASDWHTYLHEILPALGYTYVDVTVQTGGGTVPTYASDSSNPFIYKTDKFTVEDVQTHWVTENGEFQSSGLKWDSANRIRMINQAVFTSNATGKKFAVLNTHGILTGEEAKMQQSHMAKAIAEDIIAQYNCPTAIIGDMNYDEGSKYYMNTAASETFADSKYMAQNSTYRITGAVFGRGPYGETDYSAPWQFDPSTIDFIFLTKDVNVKYYKVIDQDYYNEDFVAAYPDRDCVVSDHSAVFVEMYI